MAGAAVFLKVLIAAAAIVAGAVLATWGMIKGTQGLIWGLRMLGRGIAFLVKHVFTFVRNMISDALRSVGALLTACVLIPLALLNLIFFRWQTSKHYARALEDEAISFGLGIYRIVLGNPLHFIGMGTITDGFERRLPEVVAHAPRAARSSVRDGKFEGYKVTGVLPAGGSGARLFLAKPRTNKLQEFLASGIEDPGQVVIKAFSLSTGSTLPQIVRESRALESARRLGLVLEHELSEKSFHYVMPYVPGESLDATITKMHEKHGDAGLSDRQLRVALGYVGDLLYTLDAFHSGGLWHKDIKPNNLIVSDGRAHLVDLGLVTPLASAMTLTTHGTEYFRDPEMVRQALRGVKVHEVNGVKFDIYSTGAVLYSLVENSFPAHGSLSRITRRCPEAINWIVRRAMADVEGRYGSALEMLADIRTVLAAKNPFAVRPANLPSVSGRNDWNVSRAAYAGNPGSKRGETPSTAAAKPRRLRPVLHTGTSERTVRRSTGRSLVAAFIGLFFLAGLCGVGIMANGSNGPLFSSHRISFETSPVEWCLENQSDLSCAEPASAVGGQPELMRTQPKQLAQVAEKELDRLRRQWSRRLDENLDRVADEARHRTAAGGKKQAQSGTILVLEDLAPTTGREIVSALHAELERREFQVFGDPADGIGDERDILYEAGARAALGVADQSDPEAQLRLELYLAENTGLDALIWVTEGSEENTLHYHFVRPRKAEGPQGTFALSASASSN
jgi:serine/threonine protein kinase